MPLHGQSSAINRRSQRRVYERAYQMEIACALKKRPGSLLVGAESVQWKAAQGADAETIALSDVQSMQATPATAARLRIKLTLKDGRSTLLELATATELERARSELQAAIKRHRELVVNEPLAVPAAAAAPAAAAQGEAAAPAAPASDEPAAKRAKPARAAKKVSLERGKLLHNLELQQQLLRSNPELMRTFEQVVITTGALTNEQFWALRMDMLVTAGQQELQTTGSYNVLSTIKPTTSADNQVNIQLSREKIADLFDQYPLVRKAYNENVPKLSEGEFWKRFFMSRLFLLLRGERVLQSHPPDAIFDRYVDALQAYRQRQRDQRNTDDTNRPAPLFINVETNAQNNPETYGNNLVTTGGPASRSLIRSMNGLSYRLLLGKKREREEDFVRENSEKRLEHELLLRDLEPKQSRHHVLDLHVRMAASGSAHPETAAGAEALAAQTPAELDLAMVGTGDLVAAGAAVEALTPHAQAAQVSAAERDALTEERVLTQATTLEFLRQYWHAYATDPRSAAHLVPFLEKSLDRIAAVGGGQLQPLTQSVHRALQTQL